MKKVRLIYDISVILEGQTGTANRTGVYFCAYNILKKLKKNTGITIYLYTKNYNKSLLNASKKIDIIKGLKFIRNHDISIYKKNVDFHLNSIANSNNIFFKFIILLKIIKNILQIICINKKNIDKELRCIDAFFSPYEFIPEIINSYNISKFMLLYDVTPILFPDYFPKGKNSSWEKDMFKNLDKKTHYFCISECTGRDFIKYFGKNLDEKKMTVTYISSANEFVPKYDQYALEYITNKYKLDISHYKYIFSFCSLEHRKNLIFTVKCFIKFIKKNNINDLYFLFGGVQWDNFIGHFNEALVELSENYREKIIRLGYVDDSDVNMLYSNSLFFTYLSQYEGFGMPLLEAMQAGTPVIASNNSSLPEVTGDAAITIDYDDEEACISAMETFYFNENIRQEYIKKGFERAKLFSWDKTVDLISSKIKNVTKNAI
jgi:glycosyltransferase involved in cell wall biosynthesis